ncbi:MAG: hypothetical protein C4558_04790 [Dehalococcoidia bacterium]|nr:MAG: hypothetical protein C4558_04790 [Dehalococcoidia bacterium]
MNHHPISNSSPRAATGVAVSRACSARAVVLATFAIGLALLLAACGPGGSPDAPGSDGELRFQWVAPDGFPATVSLHRALDGQRTGETHAYPSGEAPLLGEALADRVLRVRLDEPQRVVLRLNNQRGEPLRFWVAPHLPRPHSGDTALMAQCLCTGEVYEVPAGGSWARVLEFGIRRRGAVTPLGVTHVIVLGELPQ